MFILKSKFVELSAYIYSLLEGFVVSIPSDVNMMLYEYPGVAENSKS